MSGCPVSNLVGGNAGWKLVTNQLNHERVALGVAAADLLGAQPGFGWAQNTKDGHGRRLIDSGGSAQPRPGARQGRGAQADRLGARLRHRPLTGGRLGHQVFGTELATEAYRLLMESSGRRPRCVRQDSPVPCCAVASSGMHRSALILTFGGGTSEIQRDIIGMVALGCPPVNR